MDKHVLADIAEVPEDSTRRKERVKTIWLKSVKPWITVVICCTFFYLSTMQSVSYTLKYVQGPINTVMTLEEFTVDDFPWITICPSPGINFTALQAYFNKPEMQRFILASSGLFTDALYFTADGITNHALGEFPPMENKTVSQFLDEVMMPVWANIFKCTIVDPNMGRKLDCGFPTIRKRIDFRRNKPIIHSTQYGDWETDLVAGWKENWKTVMTLCSTFKPNNNFTLQPGVTRLEIKFGMSLKDSYGVKNEYLRRLISLPGAMPIQKIFVSQPYDKLDIYGFVSQRKEVTKLTLGVGSDFELSNLEKYIFLDRSSYRCLEDPGAIQAVYQCRTVCFESTFLGSSCRIPGFRNATAFPKETAADSDSGGNQTSTRICDAPEDFLGLEQLNWFESGSEVLGRCRDRCSEPCVRYDYVWRESAVRYATNTEVVNFSAVVNDATMRTSSLGIYVKSPRAKRIQQEYAYDFDQFLGELGGSWGLFLGLSLVSIMTFVEEVVLSLL